MRLIYKSIDEFLPDELSLADIKLLWRINLGHFTSKTAMPSYFRCKYGVDANEHLNTLQSLKLVNFYAGSATLQLLKVSELKEALKKFNLPLSGKKENLIDRIKININETDILSFNPHRIYYLTILGEKTYDMDVNYLNAYELLDNYFDITTIDSETFLEVVSNIELAEVKSLILNKFILSSFRMGDISVYHSNCIRAYTIYSLEGNYKLALKYLIQDTLIRVSLIKNLDMHYIFSKAFIYTSCISEKYSTIAPFIDSRNLINDVQHEWCFLKPLLCIDLYPNDLNTVTTLCILYLKGKKDELLSEIKEIAVVNKIELDII